MSNETKTADNQPSQTGKPPVSVKANNQPEPPPAVANPEPPPKVKPAFVHGNNPTPQVP